MNETLVVVERARNAATIMGDPVARTLLLPFFALIVFGEILLEKANQDHAAALEDEGGGGGGGH